MDNGQLDRPLSDSDENKAETQSLSYTKTFYKVFPYYLSIGMTYEQFWNEDCELVKYYREADKLRRERKNTELWLQGMYIYEALCDVSPVLHAFSKNGTKPLKYSDAPYGVSDKHKENTQQINKAKTFMEVFMVNHNKKFKNLTKKE